MRLQNNNQHPQTQLIVLHNDAWLQDQRVVGIALAEIMCALQNLLLKQTAISLLDIDAFVEREIKRRGFIATFKNYRGFPSSICLSVNQQLVHGIATDYQLQAGDVVSFDFGITHPQSGAIVDSALTMIFGESQNSAHAKLMATTQQCLYNAIKAIRIGLPLGVVGNAIYKTASTAGCGVIVRYGGHGLEAFKPHAPPFVANKSSPTDGVLIQSGMSIAIEPLCAIGSTDTYVASDNWTVICRGEMCAHFEHTLFVHSDHVEVLTLRPDEETLLPRRNYFN